MVPPMTRSARPYGAQRLGLRSWEEATADSVWQRLVDVLDLDWSGLWDVTAAGSHLGILAR
jgi:hypothetical protein